MRRSTSGLAADASHGLKVLSLDEYSERMRTAAVMLAQLNANQEPSPPPGAASGSDIPVALRWIPGSSWLTLTPPVSEVPSPSPTDGASPYAQQGGMPMRMKLQSAEAGAIRDRIMQEMLALEEERMERMRDNRLAEGVMRIGIMRGDMKTAEDEGIIRRELSKVDPSAVVMGESWATKKVCSFYITYSEISLMAAHPKEPHTTSIAVWSPRSVSPLGSAQHHPLNNSTANWDCVSVIVKTGGDLRQEQLAVQIIQEFEKIWKDENCACWVR